MKTAIALAVLVALLPLPARAADAAFDMKEKISLDLKDAKIADVVTMLGALASLPVYIDPDVDGTITIKVEDVPYEKVLKMLNGKTGVNVRIEGGKLVASRSSASLAAALVQPPGAKGAARIPVSEVRNATADLPPITAQIRVRGEDRCARLQFRDAAQPTITVPLSEDGSVPPLYVTQFDVDPVTRTRYLALDGAVAGGLVVGRLGGPMKLVSADGSVVVAMTEKVLEPCREESLREPTPRSQVQLYFVAREAGPQGPGEVVMAPSIQLSAGTVAKARTGRADPATGQQREVVLAVYLSRDAKWTTSVLTPTAIWVDPADGQEYFYTQPMPSLEKGRVSPVSTPSGAVPEVSSEPEPGQILLTVPPGAASPRGIELFLVSPRAKPEPRERQ